MNLGLGVIIWELNLHMRNWKGSSIIWIKATLAILITRCFAIYVKKKEETLILLSTSTFMIKSLTWEGKKERMKCKYLKRRRVGSIQWYIRKRICLTYNLRKKKLTCASVRKLKGLNKELLKGSTQKKISIMELMCTIWTWGCLRLLRHQRNTMTRECLGNPIQQTIPSLILCRIPFKKDL